MAAPSMLRLFPPPSTEVSGKDLYLDLSFPEPPPERPYVFINMVSSLDGKAAISGRAGSIGGEADRRVMRNLRSLADAVMIGAGTLRAEKISLSIPDHLTDLRSSLGKSRQPLAVVLSRDKQLPLTNLVSYAIHDTLILGGETGPEGRETKIGDHLRELREKHNVLRLLVEGGPSLNHSLIEAGLVDELFLTISPLLLGGSRGDSVTILEGALERPRNNLELLSAHLLKNELFLRYTLSRATSSK